MKNYLVLAAAAVVLSASALPALAAPQTLTGEVISLNCYSQNKRNVGKVGHLCALGDVKWEGNPPALLTADGKVYQIAGPIVLDNNAHVAPFLGRQVTITGEVSEYLGLSIIKTSEITPKD